MNVPISACSNCGEEISPKWIVCPICRHPAGEQPAMELAEDIDPVFHFAEILCIKCKKQISPDTQICPHCHVPIIRRYCSGCQRLIPDHVHLCPYCHAEPTMKKGWGKVSKAAIFLVLPFCLIFAYITFRPTDSAVKRIPLPEPDTRQSGIPDSEPSEADFLRSAPAPQLIPDPPVPPAISPIDETDIQPSRATNTVEVIQQKVQPKQEQPAIEVQPVVQAKPLIEAKPVIQTPPNFASRGARLKQGRQLRDLGTRLVRQKQYVKAAYVLQDAIRAFPPETTDLSYGEALYVLGYSLRMSGKPAEAIPVLKKALNFPFIKNKAAQELKSASDQMEKTQRVQWVKP
jgi:RNA polymerase subunit RPABC4/transcription elongation factor Spt4